MRQVPRGVDAESILRDRHGAVAQRDARAVLPVGDRLERRAALEPLALLPPADLDVGADAVLVFLDAGVPVVELMK